MTYSLTQAIVNINYFYNALDNMQSFGGNNIKAILDFMVKIFPTWWQIMVAFMLKKNIQI